MLCIVFGGYGFVIVYYLFWNLLELFIILLCGVFVMQDGEGFGFWVDGKCIMDMFFYDVIIIWVVYLSFF